MITERRLSRLLAGALAVAAIAGAAALPAPSQAVGHRAEAAEADAVERGRYVARIGGCNDCHTPNYPETGGNVPESEWLTGSAVGWQGPWGTTYPANLRTFMQALSEDQWVQFAHSAKLRPPMPWFALRDMSEADLRALYALVRHLGPAGGPAPAYVPPGTSPQGPVIRFPAPPQVATAK
jgi:mono/diheme cytochrome c family protein